MHARRALTGFLLVAMTGCYSYVPATVETVRPGQAVRVRLTREETERLQLARVSDQRFMDAVVVEKSAGELLVDTHVGTLDPRRGTRPLIQRINIAFTEIQEVEMRRRDHLKTGAAIGGFVLATTVVILAAREGGLGGRDGGGSDTPEFGGVNITALRIAF